MPNPLRLVLIDDNPHDCDLAIRALRHDFPDLQVTQMSEGQEFAHHLEQGDFDLIITDYQLRWMNGLAVLRAVKARWPDCPVIMFTDTGNEEIAVEGMKAGLSDYLIKTPQQFSRLPEVVRAALEQAHQHHAHHEVEVFYQRLFETVPIGLYRTTPDGRVLDANPALVTLLGYPDRESLMAVNVVDLYVNAEDRQRWQTLMERDVVVHGFEAQIHWHDGTIRWVKDTARAVHDAAGRVLSYEGSLEDITEYKQTEEQLRATVAAEHRRMEEAIQEEKQRLQAHHRDAIGHLMGRVVHHFNNLLMIVIGYSEMTLRRLDPLDPLRKDIEEIKQAGERATGLTRQLLAFSRRQAVHPQPLNLNGMITSLDEMLQRLLGEDVQLETDLDPALGPIRADLGQIEQVFVNLAATARETMPEGGTLTIQTANVDIDAAEDNQHGPIQPGRYVRLTVRDTGEGTDEGTLARLFEPFFTTKESGKGIGLSLAAVHEIVTQNGGRIQAMSAPGQGTTFIIDLPRVVEAGVVVEQPSVPVEPARGTETVLLVEDEKGVRTLAKQVLREAGYTVLEASNGGEALLLCEQYTDPIHLLVTDVVLPRMNGRTLADRLMRMRRDMKVLYMSGYTNDTLVRSGMLDADATLLQKPFTPAALTQKIREVLNVGNR
ncbi:MAG: response regulator [Candidatus Latescibacteria bacterium]|nr:response regulator [Candidatus Latescibacterota bacterium]